MKLNYYIIIGIFIWGTISSALADTSNLFKNGDFEKGVWRRGPESWLSTGQFKITPDGINGSKAVTLTSIYRYNSNNASLNQTIENTSPGKYSLTGSVQGDFNIAYVLFSGKGMKTALQKIDKSAFNEKDGWLTFQIDKVIPDGVKKLNVVIEFRCSKEGVKIKADNFSLIYCGKSKVEQKQAKTASPRLHKHSRTINIGSIGRKQAITGQLVSRPTASANVHWNLPVIAGRDYWQMLYFNADWDKWKPLDKEEFVREAGFNGRDFFQPKGLKSLRRFRKLALRDIDIFQNGKNVANQAIFAITPDEKTADVMSPEKINDGKLNTPMVVSGDTFSQKLRYKPILVNVSIKLGSNIPLGKIIIYSGAPGFAKNNEGELSSVKFFTASGKEIVPTSVKNEKGIYTAEFQNAPRTNSVTLKCASTCMKHRIDLSENPDMAKRLENKLICLHPPYRSSTLFGKTIENLDIPSYKAFIKKYGKNFLGFEIGEWDSNYFQFQRAATPGHIQKYGEYFSAKIPKDRYQAEKELRNLFNYHQELCLGYFVPHCGGLRTQQYGCEFGATASLIQLGQMPSFCDNRLAVMYGRGAGRQYNVPWGTYLNYFNGLGYPNSVTANHLCWGLSPSYTLRYFLYAYYMGETFQEFESQVGMAQKHKDGTFSLTKNGEAVKTVYEWQKNPKGKRGDAYSPILFLVDYHHGQIADSRSRGIFYYLPYKDGDYMSEHFMNALSDISKRSMPDAPPYNIGMVHSKMGDICDFFFANAPSGIITIYELGKYAVVILMDKIAFSPELVKNLKDYVKAGGTVLINSAQADAFKDDQEFLGVTLLEGFTNHDFMKFRNIKIGKAMTVMTASDGKTPIMLRNAYGKGNVLFTVPYFMLLSKNPQQNVPAVEKIMLAIQDEVVPVKVSGDVVYLYNRMPNGTWKVILINNKGVSKKWNESEDVVHSEYAAKVTLTVPHGSKLRAVEVYADDKIIKNGNVFTLTVPAGEVRIVDFIGITFGKQEKPATTIGSPEFGKAIHKVRNPSLKPYRPIGEIGLPDPGYVKNSGTYIEYKFNEGSGNTVKDSSPNHFNAKSIGTEYVKTQDGYAMKFTGKDSTVQLKSKGRKYGFLKHGTLEFFAKPSYKPGKISSETLVCNSTFFIQIINGRWHLMVYTQGTVLKLFGPVAKMGEWQHIAVTWDGYLVRFYINGKEVIDPLGRLTLLDSCIMNKWLFGSHNFIVGDSKTSYIGLIDDFRIIGRSLSAGEIVRHSKAGQNK